MKKIITFAMVCASFSVMSQIKINSKDANITLPSLVTRAPTSQKIASRPSDGTVDVSALSKGNYQLKGQSFNISSHPQNNDSKFIAERKLEMENRKRRYNPNDQYYEIYVTKVNGFNALVSRNRTDSQNSYYVFYVINSDFSSYVNGMLFYKASDEIAAKNNLNEILEGVNFK